MLSVDNGMVCLGLFYAISLMSGRVLVLATLAAFPALEIELAR